ARHLLYPTAIRRRLRNEDQVRQAVEEMLSLMTLPGFRTHPRKARRWTQCPPSRPARRNSSRPPPVLYILFLYTSLTGAEKLACPLAPPRGATALRTTWRGE